MRERENRKKREGGGRERETEKGTEGGREAESVCVKERKNERERARE